jgi:hypothetical protein
VEGLALMGRLAALLILMSQLLLLWVTFAPSGASATWFSFAGTPMLVVGVPLGFLALTRRLRREAAEKAAGAAPPS